MNFKLKTPEERVAEYNRAARMVAQEEAYNNPPDFDDLFQEDELVRIDAVLDEEYRSAAKEKCGSAQWRYIRENISRLEAMRDEMLGVMS